VLPGIALGTIPLAIVTRITRAAVLEVVNEDYVRTAKAKGLTGRVVNRRHVLKNAMLPITTVIGLQTGLLLSGAVLTEIVFAWGGMGSFLYQAVFDRDFPVLQGGILFLAVVFVLVNLLVDIGYGLLDPRIRVR
jgi:peptide/nickel transport system permease protein